MELFKYKDLIKELVVRDIKVKYKKISFGDIMEYFKSPFNDDSSIDCFFGNF